MLISCNSIFSSLFFFLFFYSKYFRVYSVIIPWNIKDRETLIDLEGIATSRRWLFLHISRYIKQDKQHAIVGEIFSTDINKFENLS